MRNVAQQAGCAELVNVDTETAMPERTDGVDGQRHVFSRVLLGRLPPGSW